MKKLLALLLSLTMVAAPAIPVFAADVGSPPSYSFGSGGDTLGGFGGATSTDAPVIPDPMNENIRRNKDAAFFPPAYGVFSGEIPTAPSSPYHHNLRESGFISQNQDLPPVGGEDYAPGSSQMSVGWLPSTSQAETLNTTPWYYADGTIGTLYVERTGKTIKIYEGESLDNMKKGAGHFSSTSAWDGNVALAGHNRGSSAYFSFVKDLQNGDTLTYTTRYGTRTYIVYSKTQINEYDNLPLSWSVENILTLITCVADVPELRYSVQAREVK